MKIKQYFKLLPAYLLIMSLLIFLGYGWGRGVTAFNQTTGVERSYCIVLDAGHGGVDGGATSCTGILESKVNLEIAMRVNDLLNLIGVKTSMIRTSDTSIHTEGTSIAQKKISDLKNRVRIVNSTKDAILVSIHQNHFSDAYYRGAQVFYAPTDGSADLAKQMQDRIKSSINEGSTRQIKKANGIYLMQHISCPGILIECGFLSNPEEEALLNSADYQKKMACVIATTISGYLSNRSIT